VSDVEEKEEEENGRVSEIQKVGMGDDDGAHDDSVGGKTNYLTLPTLPHTVSAHKLSAVSKKKNCKQQQHLHDSRTGAKRGRGKATNA
jgi:hypothetical protein